MKEIAASELRIGNYITSKQWKGCHAISGTWINEDGNFFVLVNGFEHVQEDGKYFDLEFIPLTEQILIELGLHETHERGYYRLNENFIISVDWQIYFEDDNNRTTWVAETPYIHQLQNAYFVLSGGQELSFTLSPEKN